MYQLSNRSLERLNGVKPILIDIVKEAIKESPFDFGIPQDGGVRADNRQNELFKAGKSKADGYIKRSNHQPKVDGYGYAFDVYAYVDGKASWEKGHLTAIARHIQKVAKEKFNISLIWGGDWKSFKDLPHFEL